MVGSGRCRAAAIAALAALAAVGPPAAAEGSTERVEAGPLAAVVETDPWRLSFEAVDGGATLREAEGSGPGPDRLGYSSAGVWASATRARGVSATPRALTAVLETSGGPGPIEVRISSVRPGVIRVEATAPVGSDASGTSFAATAEEGFFGFGERSNAVDQRGRNVENYVSDGPFPSEDRNFIRPTIPPWGLRDRDDATYYPVPWLLSSRGYGVLIDRDETSRFGLAAADPSRWSLEVDGRRLAFEVYAGPRPADALRRFTAATGRQPAARAPWAYGPWIQTGQGNVTPLEEEAETLATLREADAPLSAVEAQMHFLPCGAHVGEERYLRERGAQFHANGVAHLGYFNPLICTSYEPVYGEARAAGVLQTDPATDEPFSYPAFVGGGGGPLGFDEEPLAQFDYTDPATEGFYGELLDTAYELGYDGWMEDFGEYTPPFADSADGTPGTRMHNRYPTDYHCALQRLADRYERPLSRHSRSGWIGTARCSDIVWGGDSTSRWGFDGISSTTIQGVGIGMSGVSRWSSEIGGFFALGAEQPRPPGYEQPKLTPELLKRWIEVGATQPVMRTKHSGVAIPSYDRPQVFDPEILPVWRRYAKLHTQLYPYLLAADATYRRTGLPIMRHGLLTHPEDPAAWRDHDQYMLGPALLVAPVVEPDRREQEIYAPRGRWLDFWRSVRFVRSSGAYRPRAPRILRGARRHTLKAPLGQVPMLIRAGQVLPLLPADVETLAEFGGGDLVNLADRRRRLVLLAFPRGSSESDFNAAGRLWSREGRGRWTLRIASKRKRRYAIKATLSTLRHPFEPRTVAVRGRRLDPRRWKWDPQRGVLRIRATLRRGKVVVGS